jgi:hypothetical protein
MFDVLKSTSEIAKKSILVHIDEGAILSFSERVADGRISLPPWDDVHHFSGTPEETAAYTLILDTLNFCFWPAPGQKRWGINYQGTVLSGYRALASALKQAMEEETPLMDARFLADLREEDLANILGGKGDLQFMECRLAALRELGGLLNAEYGGKAHMLIASARRSALKLAHMLASRLDSFRDVATYDGKTVAFLKRAQIVAADLHGAFQGKSWGAFTDMNRLTAFADYKVPQVLRHLDILIYEPDLAEKVARRILLEAGGREEVEIRANTIIAVEKIREALERRGSRLYAFQIDGYLWNLGQEAAYRIEPYHRTATIFY